MTDVAQHAERIRERNKRRKGEDRFDIARKIGRYHQSGAADILAELVQNAEDAGARGLGFRCLEKGLLAWNDGRPFTPEDLEDICGIFDSHEDERSIGFFGVGFKSVLVLTEEPRLLSGPYRYRLEGGLDPWPLDDEDAPPEALERWRALGQRGAVFWLPGREASARQRSEAIRRRLAEEGSRLFLCLQHLEELCWEEAPAEPLCVRVTREELFEENGRLRAWLVSAPDGPAWLRLELAEPWPEEEIARLADECRKEGDEPGAGRWERSRGASLRVSLVFRRDAGGELDAADDGIVFVGLPTREPTGLPFHAAARFPVDLGRGRIRREEALSAFLACRLQELARAVPRLLKEHGQLLPKSYRAFPAAGEPGEGAWEGFGGIAEALRAALEELGVPDTDGRWRPVGEVFLACNSRLYALLAPQEVAAAMGVARGAWVHADLREGRARKVAEGLGVKTVERKQVLTWLGGQDAGWFQGRDTSWLRRLYGYLLDAKPEGYWDRCEWENRLNALPLARLQSGRHVPPEACFFPPETDAELRDLPPGPQSAHSAHQACQA